MSDYQILAFKHQLGLITLRENGKYLLEGSRAEGAPLKGMFHDFDCNPLYSIHSVKYLPNGKIFTVGEHIMNDGFLGQVPTGIIQRFDIHDDELFVYTTWSGVGFSLHGWEHSIPQEGKKAPSSDVNDKIKYYLHSPSNIVFTIVINSLIATYKAHNNVMGTFPSLFLENSKDWIELTPVTNA